MKKSREKNETKRSFSLELFTIIRRRFAWERRSEAGKYFFDQTFFPFFFKVDGTCRKRSEVFRAQKEKKRERIIWERISDEMFETIEKEFVQEKNRWRTYQSCECAIIIIVAFLLRILLSSNRWSWTNKSFSTTTNSMPTSVIIVSG